jgi:hypothetical protein
MDVKLLHAFIEHRRRVAPKAPLGKEGSIMSRLMHNQPITIELDDSDDDLISPTKK